MQRNPWFWLFLLFGSCFAQTTSLVAGVASTGATTVTVTSLGTLAVIILPLSSSLSGVSSDVPTETTTSAPNTATSRTNLFLPPYTGQDILIGSCNTPQYTALALYGGKVLEVPLVGCSDDRPECCPSLAPPNSAITTTSEPSSGIPTPSITGPTATGVVSMLSASPLSVCPEDFVDLDPVCCPSGYRLYGQAIIGGITPCYSMLSTIATLPTSVSDSIVSAIAVTASATATVSIIIDRIYALGLPCADELERGLSTGAKAGIGIGATIGGLLLLALCVFIGVLLGKRRSSRDNEDTGYYQPTQKHMSRHESYGFPTDQVHDPNKPHASWASHTPTVLPPVEIGSPLRSEIYEIGDGERAASPQSPGNADVVSVPESNKPVSNVSAYDANQEKSGERFSNE